jgi:hypothetical protein
VPEYKVPAQYTGRRYDMPIWDETVRLEMRCDALHHLVAALAASTNDLDVLTVLKQLDNVGEPSEIGPEALSEALEEARQLDPHH